jgi:hypothetical protein
LVRAIWKWWEKFERFVIVSRERELDLRELWQTIWGFGVFIVGVLGGGAEREILTLFVFHRNF